jgi:hypothetical protein
MIDDGYLHQQARLTTGTIAHNDKLSTDFRHIDRGGMIERMYESEGSREELEREILVGEGGSCEGEWLLKMGNPSVVGVVREHTETGVVGSNRSERGYLGASGAEKY